MIRQRGAIFTTTMVLTTLAVLAPILVSGLNIAWETRRSGGFPYTFLGLNGWSYGAQMSHASMIDGCFCHLWYKYSDTPEKLHAHIRLVDPESGNVTGRAILYSADYELYSDSTKYTKKWLVGDANYLWIIDTSGHVFDVDESRFVTDTQKTVSDPPLSKKRSIRNQRDAFTLDGKLTIVLDTESGPPELLQLTDDHWKSLGLIELPDPLRRWQVIGTQNSLVEIGELDSPAFAAVTGTKWGTVDVLPIGATHHLFWNISGKLLYRHGWKLTPSIPDDSTAIRPGQIVEPPASASEPLNVASVAPEWSLISNEIASTTKVFPIAVGGEPAVLLVEKAHQWDSTVVAMRLEHGGWVEFARYECPVPAINPNAGSNVDGSISWLIVPGMWDRIRTLAIEPTGFRQTRYQVLPWRAIDGFQLIYEAIGWSLILGLVLASVAGVMMLRDPNRYGFRHQSVTLPTIWERGIARVIDLSLVTLPVIGVFLMLTMTFDVDWFAVAESISINMPHPSIPHAINVAIACEVVAGAVWLAIVLMQGVWSVTPGKWICGLRTIRTTLTRCGIRRSLIREVLLCVDSLNLISWAPGIVCLAFTENRQRIGDIVADTIVVRHRRHSYGSRPEIPPYTAAAIAEESVFNDGSALNAETELQTKPLPEPRQI